MTKARTSRLLENLRVFEDRVSALVIVHEAYQLGAPGHVIVRMLGNVALDGVFGAVPLVGDAFDVLWRANRRNVQLLQEWLDHERWR